ncbi:hypothetical protein O7610_16575 [Solwaraspora sp. WMMA2065]|nr:hypothetical protein [Solwaraspora sp. WMMA2065]WJK32392.1 hypothetical protein O7610_16575 [Solwaraspora sp. WMMA2065]
MGRRICLTLLGFALTSSADEWNIAYQPSDVTFATGRPLSGEVVDHLDTITASLRRMDDHLGSGQTLGLVCQHLATVVEVLRERRYTDSVGRRLHGTAGELMRLAGWLSFDDGNHSQAQQFWIAGLYQAHAAGDRGLGANILGFMSYQAADLGQFWQSITLVEPCPTPAPTAVDSNFRCLTHAATQRSPPLALQSGHPTARQPSPTPRAAPRWKGRRAPGHPAQQPRQIKPARTGKPDWLRSFYPRLVCVVRVEECGKGGPGAQWIWITLRAKYDFGVRRKRVRHPVHEIALMHPEYDRPIGKRIGPGILIEELVRPLLHSEDGRKECVRSSEYPTRPHPHVGKKLYIR